MRPSRTTTSPTASAVRDTLSARGSGFTSSSSCALWVSSPVASACPKLAMRLGLGAWAYGEHQSGRCSQERAYASQHRTSGSERDLDERMFEPNRSRTGGRRGFGGRLCVCPYSSSAFRSIADAVPRRSLHAAICESSRKAFPMTLMRRKIGHDEPRDCRRAFVGPIGRTRRV